ncbi:hypothetical protein FE391_14055 [Nonomuraea sp. KC401]|uniref:RraA family protein n=1 Tax=unclassified Nonomuraea TaxID=2593643 RepID=UPI0010FCE6E5|nr:hypothetical protein [Nonomuraea sp. KC401]TLF74689.1 hypothetical protein FE391_14055 [Nonomuraea sp. KC401]
MRTAIVTDPPRADGGQVAELAAYGVATVHEALGRTGHLGPQLRPTHLGSRIGGTAVTVLCWPGDNLTLHAAVEQCRPGAGFRACEPRPRKGLDRYGLRAKLTELGVTYVTAEEYGL